MCTILCDISLTEVILQHFIGNTLYIVCICFNLASFSPYNKYYHNKKPSLKFMRFMSLFHYHTHTHTHVPAHITQKRREGTDIHMYRIVIAFYVIMFTTQTVFNKYAKCKMTSPVRTPKPVITQ